MKKDKNIVLTGSISCGITWVYGSVLFKGGEKWAKSIFGICHYSKKVFAISPIDYLKVTMMTTIEVSPKLQYCDHAGVCLYFDCPMNRFRKEKFYEMFKEHSGFSLGIPEDFGTKGLWFNLPPYAEKWSLFLIPIHGGVIKHKKDIKAGEEIIYG